MAKTLAQIRTITRMFLDEANEADWTNTELDYFINQRYHRVYSAVLTVFEDYKITTSFDSFVANQQEYTLPSGLFKIRRIEVNYDVSNANSVFQKANPLTSLENVRTRLAETNLGTSILRDPVYFVSGSTVYFLPIPTTSGTNAIKYWYIPVLSDLASDASTIDIPYPDRYYNIIAVGAAADALRMGQQESAEADKLDQKFVADVLLMQEELEDRVADDSKFVTDVSGDSLDFGGGY